MSDDKKDRIYTPKKTVKYFVFTFIATTIACMIIWPLFDLIWSKITNSTYGGWNVTRGLVEPIIFGLIATIIEFIFFNQLYGKNKK